MSLLAWAQAAPPAARTKTPALDPPGYSTEGVSKKSKAETAALSQTGGARPDASELQLAKAWEISYSPAKNLPMNAIMLYMSGNSVQIFSMMALATLFSGAITGMASVEQTFARFSSPKHSLLLPKMAWIGCQFAAIALGLWKCWSMGLLPTESSDWLAWRQPRIPLEFTPLRS